MSSNDFKNFRKVVELNLVIKNSKEVKVEVRRRRGYKIVAFVFQMINITIYLCYLFLLSRSPDVPLAVYWTAEQLYVLVLLVLSLFYLKRNTWQNKSL